MPIEAVIFDIGNVLIEWQPERFYDREIGMERRKAMFTAVDLHGMNEQIDLGADFRATIYAAADQNPEFGDEIRMWHDRWIELAQPVIPKSVNLLRRLRSKGVPVFALTNFGSGSFDYAETQYDFLGEFDRRYISGHLGIIKPDPEIYQIVEDDCGVAPECLIFADDRLDNVAVADARGWQTYLFDGPDGWAARLVDTGLLTDAEVEV